MQCLAGMSVIQEVTCNDTLCMEVVTYRNLCGTRINPTVDSCHTVDVAISLPCPSLVKFLSVFKGNRFFVLIKTE